ncbi:Putative Holin-X, holin superfamily III [Methylomagnum ishizawai]|uniref:Holin-X, holin superfamily III n=1 Tax=Methylomagnum ishizawai TaxID=1760988 RepID=A0A1Y6DED2_9GAMM|nr:phage holin family protein [Methylomagnum ishizawai]SMF97795.1 Putative Holin-X, holin superfamily III [Methylomagnum ishizawai]
MTSDENPAKREFSLATLFSDLSREFSTLARQETQLVKAEIAAKLADAKAGAGGIAIGGGLLLVGILILALAWVAGVNQMLGATALDYPWLSPLLVGLALTAAGTGLLLWGRHNLKLGDLAPRRSGESLRRDSELLKEQFK